MAQCEIARQFFEMMQAIAAEQKTPRDYGTGELLFHSELDLLEKIFENPQQNVSDLAALCDVSKSAITQLCNKLLEKGLIEKYSLEKNKKEKYFALTQQGETVRALHAQYRQKAAQEMRAYLCALDGQAKKTILSFLPEYEALHAHLRV